MKKDDWTYSVYFATLRTGHDDIAVGLNVSIGKWWDDLALTAAVVRLEAHAVPKSSSPTVGIVVAGPVFPVTLTYTIHWQVLVPDGQISRGELPFTVKNL
jgi:hypothetical protein